MSSKERSYGSKRATTATRRHLPVGAEVQRGGVHFRVWAPRRRRITVVVEAPSEAEEPISFPLQAEGNGYFSGLLRGLRAGARYQFRLDGRKGLFPDPASRYQPAGPHGPSEVIDPGAFAWTDDHWRGIDPQDQVIYEMHAGTFTVAGTWAAAAEELPELRRLGVTTIELLPLAEFGGRFGWGYDGVDLFAPSRLYGTPDDLRRFIDRAHAVGLGVILDVVYNHLGPEGNYLAAFCEQYFARDRATDWGDAINFDGPDSAGVREFFLANAEYWIGEFHFDGLRIDATQDIHDDSEPHILAQLVERVQQAAGARRTYVVAENEPQDVRLLLPPERGGFGASAVWNDDFHHAAVVAMTGRNEAYYTDYRGGPQEFISLAKRGFLYQGQFYEWQGKRRGTPALGLEPSRFVHYLDNHDQVANSGRGYRAHMQTSPGRYRAMTAVLLLFPQTPMLFQGQEFAASTRFFYFADHREDLAAQVDAGRAQFLAQFPSLATAEMRVHLPDPADPGTFVDSKLDLKERHTHGEIYAMHLDLLRIRREDPVISSHGRGGLDGAVLGPEAFVLRYFAERGDDRLLLVNLGRDVHLTPAPEPLLAPPEGARWGVLWSSEDPRYGGRGTACPEGDRNWRIPGHAAVLLAPHDHADGVDGG